MTVKSSSIDPDGGELVELVVPESETGYKKSESEAMPKVKLTKIDLEWVHVIREGWASPLKGYLQSLHFNSLRLKDGTRVNMSLPILAVDDETKEQIGSSQNVALVCPQGDIIGSLRRCERTQELGRILQMGLCPNRWNVLVKYYESLREGDESSKQ